MRYRSLIQLKPQQFDIHFPPSCRDGHLSALAAMTELLAPGPVADLRAPEIDGALSQVDILITGWGSRPVDADLRRRMPNLKLIAHLAGTVKALLTPEIADSGLRVVNAVAANARPVSEFTVAHILLHLKRVEDWRRIYRERRSAMSTRTDPMQALVGNRGRTVGIVGASRIGRLVIGHLRRHQISVLLHDPFLSEDEVRDLGATKATMEQLLTQSDVVSLHQPLLPNTERSFGAAEFARMRDGALLINTARGRIIDTAALEAAMADGRLRAVIDVTDPEPLNDDSPLWDMDNVQLTPHIAGSFGHEVCDMTQLVLSDIERFCRGEPLQNEVAFGDWERLA
ncbi:hydroxyacid dehydrogenase [Oceaniglobus trochenteri]|uniref:hydroxyacid dehydrogenase n=1 Tax=Oceaniglobus trochenteri TaxID=2763260 RepID=UPI001CFFE384|nr:hydroxyacid dehydrogenase [Oceaniglobus trochenteri]